YHVLPDQDPQSACLRRSGHALTADGGRVGVSGTTAQNLDPTRCGTGQTPRSGRDPRLCHTAKCCAGYSNANDGCVLQTDCRDQPLSPVNGPTCSLLRHISAIDGQGETNTPPSAYPSCSLYCVRHRDWTMGGGGHHHRRCYDRSPWACLTSAK